MSTKDEWLSIGQIAEELQVSRSTVYYWRQTGTAPRATRLPNGELRVRRSWLDAWLEEREVAA
jgi:excisionase family DNA binding protein